MNHYMFCINETSAISSINSLHHVSGCCNQHRRSDDMKCYSDVEGIRFQQCQKKMGYRTCFTQHGKSK